jgi:hypothetical protein
VNSVENGGVRLVEVAIPFQAMLALRLYHLKHPEESIDELHPSAVDRGIRGKAMELWLDETGGEALSAKFRAYIDDPAHAEESVSLSDTDVLDTILATIGAPTSQTLH